MKTIFAPATPPGRSGVAVIRISGPSAAEVLAALDVTPLPAPRVATLANLRHPQHGDILDKALVLWFPAPHSFTGEDVAELHLHGSRAVTHAVIETLATLPGLRLAEPGEFSKQAFFNGKMDLTQAEGLADLIDAQTSAQRRQAMRQMEGGLKTLYDGLRETIIKTLAFLEAYIDFPEEDIPDSVNEEIRASINSLITAIGTHLKDGHKGERLREGIHAVIVGPPNAGKSSLLNALAGRDVAIVSEIAGTTRDIIEVQLELGGLPLTLADTAGLRDSADEIESEGIRRARERAHNADLKLVLVDASSLNANPPLPQDMVDDTAILLLNKVDLCKTLPSLPAPWDSAIPLSVTTGTGMDVLIATLEKRVSGLVSDSDTPVITRARYRIALENAVFHLKNYLSSPAIELACEELRRAAVEIGSITGRISVEDILDVVFRNFCIGK